MYRILLLAPLLLAGGAEWAAASGGLEMATEWSWPRDGGRIINSLVVLGAAAWLALKYVGPMLTKRATDIADNLKSLQRATVEAESRLTEYNVRLSEIEKRADEARREAAAEGELITKKVIAQAKETAERMIERASAQIDLETSRARERIQKETLVAAVDMAEKILSEKMGPEDQGVLVRSFLDKVEDAR